jgi:phospholipid/cholesterol/gamma-HCH transport system substrate-binding protein
MESDGPTHGLQIEFREKMVGLFIIIAMSLALGIIVFIGRGQQWFKEKATYYIYFDEGYNLKPGSQVKLFNTWIGSVDKVELTKDNRVKVTIKVFKDLAGKIRSNSVATVDSPTIIGSEFIAITPGSIDLPAIPKGGVIPAKPKKTIAEYLKEFEVQKKIEDFGQLISDLRIVLERIKDPKGPLFSILDNIEDMTNKMKNGEGNLGRLVMREDLYREVELAIKEIRGISAGIKELTGHMDKSVQSLPDTMEAINDSVHKLDHVMSQLKTAMERAPAMQRQLEDALTETNSILESVKKNFFIRMNLPPEPAPEVHVPEVRGVGR